MQQKLGNIDILKYFTINFEKHLPKKIHKFNQKSGQIM
jgi:hypothetical protein